MNFVTMTMNDLSLFRACQETERLDWSATFSAEPNGDVYPFITRGPTPYNRRIYLRSEFPKLAEIADLYLRERPTGGRFFIDRRGAFFHEAERGPFIQFVKFSIVDDVVYVPASKKIR